MQLAYQQLHIPSDASFAIREHHQPQFTASFHFHHAYEVIFIARSFGKLYAGNKAMNYNEGDIYVFGPGLGHCFYNDQQLQTPGEMAHAIALQFSVDFMGKDFLEKPELGVIRHMLQEAREGIRFEAPPEVIRELFFQFRENRQMANLLLLLHLLDQLSLLPGERLAAHGGHIYYNKTDAARMEAVFKYIMDNYREQVNLKKAAALAHLNEAAFCRYFKRRTRKTFSEFVNEIRIAHATRLLLTTNDSISDICYACGYSNVSYFNRQFLLQNGQSPRAYREAHTKFEKSDV